MQYHSTRSKNPCVDSAQAVLEGLAPDGGIAFFLQTGVGICQQPGAQPPAPVVRVGQDGVDIGLFLFAALAVKPAKGSGDLPVFHDTATPIGRKSVFQKQIIYHRIPYIFI